MNCLHIYVLFTSAQNSKHYIKRQSTSLHLYKAYDSSYTIKLCYEVRYSHTKFINSIDF